jgi:hypothetical protein
MKMVLRGARRTPPSPAARAGEHRVARVEACLTNHLARGRSRGYGGHGKTWPDQMQAEVDEYGLDFDFYQKSTSAGIKQMRRC